MRTTLEGLLGAIVEARVCALAAGLDAMLARERGMDRPVVDAAVEALGYLTAAETCVRAALRALA